MSSNIIPLNKQSTDSSAGAKWTQRRDIPLTILAWIVLIGVVLWAASHVGRSLLLLAIAALLAYALAPLVRLFQRVMPRFLAILIVYLIVLGALSFLIFFLVRAAIAQVDTLRLLLIPRGNGQLAPLLETLKNYGITITPDQIDLARQQLISHLENILSGALPVLKDIGSGAIDIVVVAILSIYLLVDGARVMRWLRANAPLFQRERVIFFLDTLERVVGGYIRGQLTLAVLIGLLVGVGMAILRVPYATLLGMLAFVLAFIPLIGTFISAAACILLALTSTHAYLPIWLLAIVVLVYFVAVHLFESHIVGPRIVGHALGLHPGLSILALIAGGELFGIWGTLFAAPIAGLVQAVLVALWIEWRKVYPEQFPIDSNVDHIPIESEATEKLDKITPTATTDSQAHQ